MKKAKYNKSKSYLLPLLLNHVKFELKYFSKITNTFVFDSTGSFKNCLFIVYNFDEISKEIESYIRKIKKEDLLLKCIKRKNKYILIFKFPKQRIQDYRNFVEGKYSNYLEDSKNIIINFYAELYSHNMNAIQFLIKLKQVLFKNNTLKEKLEKSLGIPIPEGMDLLDKIVESDETFEIPSIKKLFK